MQDCWSCVVGDNDREQQLVDWLGSKCKRLEEPVAQTGGTLQQEYGKYITFFNITRAKLAVNLCIRWGGYNLLSPELCIIGSSTCLNSPFVSLQNPYKVELNNSA